MASTASSLIIFPLRLVSPILSARRRSCQPLRPFRAPRVTRGDPSRDQTERCVAGDHRLPSTQQMGGSSTNDGATRPRRLISVSDLDESRVAVVEDSELGSLAVG